MGDFEILTKVLHHLIRNAIEYCGTPSPRVHISSRRRRSRMGILGAGQRSRYRPGIPGPHIRGVQAPARKRTPRERTWTRILQEGHRVAWRPDVDGVDARGGIDILFHSAACGLMFPSKDRRRNRARASRPGRNRREARQHFDLVRPPELHTGAIVPTAPYRTCAASTAFDGAARMPHNRVS